MGFTSKPGINASIVTQRNQSEITVIIPTYNRAHTLPRALHSILAQTLQPKEIIVVDDGSTDKTQSVLENYSGIKVLKQPQRGVSTARNAGIENSSGQWIAFLDSDDEWLPEKLERQWAAICGADKLVCHTEEVWIRNGQRVNPMKKHQKYGGLIYEKCLPLCIVSPSSIMINRSVFDDVGVFDETLMVCEDYDLLLRICAVYPVLFIADPLIVKYGGHDDQLSRCHWGLDRFRVMAMEKMVACGALNDDQKLATINMIVQKCKIIINGMKKRGKNDEMQVWVEKLGKYIV